MQPSINLNDQIICKKIQQGDDIAYDAFFKKYYPALVLFLRKRVQCMDTAKDLAQEVFIRLWHHRETLNPNYSLKSYMYRIAVNLTIDEQRQRFARRRCQDSYSATTHAFSSPSITLNELYEEINSTLSELPKNYQMTFILSRFESFQNQEIAESLGVSVKTVEGRITKALKLLQKNLEITDHSRVA